MDRLVPKDFLDRYSLERLSQIPRYLNALQVRVDRARNAPEKDRSKAEQVKPFDEALARLQKKVAKVLGPPEQQAALEEFRWMVEEFKVSLFAPEIKTAYPVSAKKLAAKLKEIDSIE